MQNIPKEPLKLEDTIAVWNEFRELIAKYKLVSL
jgi:hypothetical protein